MAASFGEKLERRMTLGFLLGLAGLVLVWVMTARHPNSARVAAIGGTIAFYGVTLMSIGVLRVRPLRYLENLATDDVRDMFNIPAPELSDKERELRLFETMCQNLLGPYLVGIGTLVNGFSGMF